jgi:hypothetical protein
VKSLRNVQLAERLARLGDLEDLLAIDGQGTDAAIARTDECGIRELDDRDLRGRLEIETARRAGDALDKPVAAEQPVADAGAHGNPTCLGLAWHVARNAPT